MARRKIKEVVEEPVEERHVDPLSAVEPEIYTIMVRIVEEGYTLLEFSIPPRIQPCMVTKTMVTCPSPRAPTLFRSNSIPDGVWEKLGMLREGADVPGVGRVNERGIRFLDYEDVAQFDKDVAGLWGT